MRTISYFLSHSFEVNKIIVFFLQLAIVFVFITQIFDIVMFFRKNRNNPRKIGVLLAVISFLIFIMYTVGNSVAATLMHENFYGYMLFSEIAANTPARDVYGFGYFAWQRLFFTTIGANFTALFLAVSVAAMWGLLSFFVSILRTKLGFWSAFTIAILLTTHPVLVRFARSESVITVAAAFLLISAERFAAFVQFRRWYHAAALAFILAITSQTRPEFYVIAPLFLAAFTPLIIGLSELKLLIKERKIWLVLAIFLAISAIPLHNILWRFYEGSLGSASLVKFDLKEFFRLFFATDLRSWEAGNVAISAQFSPRLHAALGAFSVVVLILFDVRFMPLFLLFLFAEMLWLPIQTAPWVGARLQQIPLILWCIFAGSFVFTLCFFVMKKHLNYVQSVASGIIIFMSIATFFGVWTTRLKVEYDMQKEFDFLQKSLQKLPQNSVILLPKNDKIVNVFFPENHQILRKLNIKIKRINDTVLTSKTEKNFVFYKGLVCYKFGQNQPETAANFMRKDCQKASRFCKIPISKTHINAPPYDFLFSSCHNCEIGFFRCLER